jgi:hypothetical protein
MRKTLINSLCALALLGLGPVALAKDHGGDGNRGGAKAQRSSHAASSSNAPWAGDKDKGQARADERRSAQGMAHEKARAGSAPAKPGSAPAPARPASGK